MDRYPFFTSTDSIYEISLSPTESKLVYFMSIPNTENTSVNILDIETGVSYQLSNISRNGNYHAAWSADGQKVAIKAGVVHVYDNEGHLLHYIEKPVGEYYQWDETGKGLYTIHSGNLLYSDSLKTDTLLTGMNLVCPAISPNRRYMACVSQAEGNMLIVIDLGFFDYESVKQITLPQSFVLDDKRIIDWSPDSREISFIDRVDNSYNIFSAYETSFYPVEQITDDDFIPKALCQ